MHTVSLASTRDEAAQGRVARRKAGATVYSPASSGSQAIGIMNFFPNSHSKFICSRLQCSSLEGSGLLFALPQILCRSPRRYRGLTVFFALSIITIVKPVSKSLRMVDLRPTLVPSE